MKGIGHRFYFLDFGRFLAALSVLVWHYQHLYYTAPGQNPIADTRSVQPLYSMLGVLYEYGGDSVKLFWVMSGFVFAAVSLDASRFSAKEFWINRVARLYPLHLATLLATALLQAISWFQTRQFQIYEFNDVRHFVLNALFISHWGFERGNSFNEPIWSVSVEIAIYVVFCFLVVPLRQFKGVVVLSALGVFLALWNLSILDRFNECGVCFFMGTLCYLTWQRLSEARLKLLVGAAMGIVGSFFIAEPRVAMWVGFSCLVLMLAILDQFDKANIGSRLRTYGDLTYGIYLLHVPTQIAFILLCNYLAIERGAVIASPTFFVAFNAVIILLAAVSYKYFELPARLRIRRLYAS